jgi:hypothetical protein
MVELHRPRPSGRRSPRASRCAARARSLGNAVGGTDQISPYSRISPRPANDPRMHPNFYPKPVEEVYDPILGTSKLKDITDGFLTQSELLKLFGRLGSVLHVKDLRKILPRKPGMEPEELMEYRNKIRDLLNQHVISMLNQKHKVLVMMQHQQHGKPEAVLLRETVPGLILPPSSLLIRPRNL